jgi:hypothetical protein
MQREIRLLGSNPHQTKLLHQNRNTLVGIHGRPVAGKPKSWDTRQRLRGCPKTLVMD